MRVHEFSCPGSAISPQAGLPEGVLTNFAGPRDPATHPILMSSGIKTVFSKHSVDQTVERLKNILQSKGITLFAIIDHSGEAEKAGLHMPPTKLVIFGNPKGGTPLMVAAPTTAIDLPLKILIAEDGNGQVSVSWNDPAYLQDRHGFPPGLTGNIAVVEALAEGAAQ